MKAETRTESELNRIIAEWCGWTNLRLSKKPYPSATAPWRGKRPGSSGYSWSPYYCRDLNALNTAIYSNYTEDIADFYAMRLWEIVNPDVSLETCTSVELLAFCNANARDRAEALVRVIELNKTATT